MVLIGFDFGMRKIGMAVGQTVSCTAQPLPPLKAQDGIPAWDDIQTIIDEWGPNALVVGMPYAMDQSEQEITFAARKFARRLENKYHLPVHLVDERLTTREARDILQEQGSHARLVDSHAAALILESWLREHPDHDH